jgi:ADP-heptose:LPS heptosyltransferase
MKADPDADAKVILFKQVDDIFNPHKKIDAVLFDKFSACRKKLLSFSGGAIAYVM